MLLAFALVLLVLILGVIANIFSIFWPFFENLSNVADYNSAYYWAVSSLERWMLVTRYKEPGFVWSGWYFGTDSFWPKSDSISFGFGRLNLPNNWLSRQINSRTKRIPAIWQWNVENLLASSDSKDYNMLWKTRSESFILSYDNTSDTTEYYTWTTDTDIEKYDWNLIQWSLRLPPKVFSWFGWGTDWLLCDDDANEFCNLDSDDLYDDIVVNWLVQWTYDNQWSFTILPTQTINSAVTQKTVISNLDNSIRKNAINNSVDNNFSGQISFAYNPAFSPLLNWWQNISVHNFISDNFGALYLANSWFIKIFNEDSVDNLKIKIWLADLLYSRNKNIYPFLEYYFDFGWDVADRFYNIIWIGRVWDYNVQIMFNKPTSNDSVIGEFDVIF